MFGDARLRFSLFTDLHYTILHDAFYLLKDYYMTVEAGDVVSSAISSCMFRVVCAMCKLLRCILPSDDEARVAIAPIFQSLLQCLLLPSRFFPRSPFRGVVL